MTLEYLQKSFSSYKQNLANSGVTNKRIRYPKDLKARATQYYKNNPELSPQRMAKLIGISSSAGDKWFRSIKQKTSQAFEILDGEPKEAFVELKPKADVKVDSVVPEITVRVTEIKIPSGTSEAQITSMLNAIVFGIA